MKIYILNFLTHYLLECISYRSMKKQKMKVVKACRRVIHPRITWKLVHCISVHTGAKNHNNNTPLIDLKTF
jgi:hypothetical protein